MTKKLSSIQIKTVVIVLGCLFIMTIATPCFSMEKATPKEIIELVDKAAKLVAADMEAGLAMINDKNGELVFKDAYIFAYECQTGKIVAHGMKPKLIGKKLTGLKDKNGVYLFVQMCEAAKRGKREWVEYWWPKPGEKKSSRKLSLLINAPGTSVQVGSGIYEENITIEELNKLSNK